MRQGLTSPRAPRQGSPVVVSFVHFYQFLHIKELGAVLIVHTLTCGPYGSWATLCLTHPWTLVAGPTAEAGAGWPSLMGGMPCQEDLTAGRSQASCDSQGALQKLLDTGEDRLLGCLILQRPSDSSLTPGCSKAVVLICPNTATL